MDLRQPSCMLLLRFASTIVTQSMRRRRRLLLTSCNECSMLPPVFTEVWSWPDVTPPRWASLAGCAREGYLQNRCNDVLLSSWSGTSIPCRPFHHVLQRRFSASSAFCKPSPAHCTSLSYQHIWPSGVFDRRSDGLELTAWRAQRSGLWFWQF